MVSQPNSVASTLLKIAIVHAFHEQQDRMARRRGLKPAEVRKLLQQGSDDLEAVRRYQLPPYGRDEVALMYLLRYQYSHANLAWSMLSGSDVAERIERNGPIPRLQVIDLGAGGFAMLLGLALFLADMIERRIAPQQVNVLSIEPSAAMRRVGEASWRALRSTASDESLLSYEQYGSIRRSIDRINHGHSDLSALPEIQPDRNAIRMLTAMHAITKDRDQVESLRHSLEAAHRHLRPHCGFMTAHSGNHDRMRAVAPFGSVPKRLLPRPMCNDEVELLEQIGELTEASRIGRAGQEIPHTFGWWSRDLRDTSVLYWPNDHQ